MTFKMKSFAAAILAGALALPGLALADHGYGNPINPNPSELRQEIREYRNDSADVGRMQRLAVRYERAIAERQYGYLPALDARLAEVLHREILETRRELAQERREVREDFRHDRRGYQVPGYYNPNPDRRDDIRDLRGERMTLARLQGMQMRLQMTRGRFDWQALQEKRAIIQELISLNRREVREDRREIREERRETYGEQPEPYFPRDRRF